MNRTQHRGHRAMPEEQQVDADMMTGCLLLRHPDNPTLAVLRIDTKGEPCWVVATRKGLLGLAKQCTKHAEKMREVQ
jgi:hypothetical protein